MPKKINRHSRFLVVCFLFFQLITVSQNETAKWYFGYGSALDFMTSPPTLLTNSAMHVDEGCASISDNQGNLLFYTDGMTIYNKQHLVMANGNGMLGGHTPTQSSLILKLPGSNSLYYVFTVHGNTWAPGLHYTLVDMSLAAGNGSVVAKNVTIYSGGIYEKITATRHCNGTDFWVVVRDFSSVDTNFSENFKAFQFGSGGINSTPVTSYFTYTANFHVVGGMRISPNGKKLACANYNFLISEMTFELFDFDNSTGVVSNSLALQTSFMNNVNSFFASGYGVEFSPDGTKLYGSLANFYSYNNNGNILEWDLCAGTNSAIALSQTTIGAATGTNYFGVGSLQLAKDGKIYVAHSTVGGSIEALSVINNPNGFGAAANFSYGVVSVPSYSPSWGLPNYGSYLFLQRPTPSPFAVATNTSVGCFGKAFTATVNQNSVGLCPASSYTINAYAWDFGDPLSGTANTSFLANPLHNFSAPGNYTTQLIIYYACGGGTDTLRQLVNVVGSASLNVSTASITCSSLGSGTVAMSNGSGSYNYSWAPTGNTTSIASGLIPGFYTITVSDNSVNCSITNTLYFAPLIPLTADVVFTPTVPCYGATTATASFINLAGGSPNQFCTWQNGFTTFTTLTTNSLSAGSWTATLTDALTACQVNSVIVITQPSQITLAIAPSSYTACVGSSIQLIANPSGGTGGFNYAWYNNSTTQSISVNYSFGGIYAQSLQVTDASGCTASQTIQLQYESTPIISVNSGSICSGNNFTLSPSGAFNYSISGGQTIVTPTISTTYTINGTGFFGCPANSAVSSITVVPSPQVSIASNRKTICLGETAQLVASGADNYLWSGGINSSSVSISPIQTTFYSVVGSNLNGCTATVSIMQVVDLCSWLIDLKGTQETNFSVYPNPNNGNFSVEALQPLNLTLVTSLGLQVSTIDLSAENQFKASVLALPKGIYFLLNSKNLTSFRKKIVIQ